VRLDLLERRLHPDVDSTSGEQVRRVVAEACRDLSEDLRRGVDEDPVLLRGPELRVVPDRVGDEVGELRERLDTGVARSDEDERQLSPPVRLVGVGRGRLQAREHVVPEKDGVGQRLEAESMLGEARDRQGPGDGAERDDQVRVAHPEHALADADLDSLARDVVGARLAEQQLRMWTHQPERNHDVTRLERPRGRLGKHRREEHVVLGTDDRRSCLAERPRDVRAGEPAAENERPATGFVIRHPARILSDTTASAWRSLERFAVRAANA
jgi:hypothetical protein